MVALSTPLRALSPHNYGIVKKPMPNYLLDLLDTPPSVVEVDVIPLNPYGPKLNPSK